MSWMGGWFDPELEDLFHDEPELLETAQQVRASRPRVEADPRFQNRLRAQLVAEASRGRGALGVRRWWRVGPAGFAWGGAVVGAALITATVLTFVSNNPQSQTVTGISQLTAQHSVSPNQVITVAFNQPMNEKAVQDGVRIQPAVKVSFSWKDNDLVISPVYHLAANTPYTVTIARTDLRAASGASAAAPIYIPFGTAPTPTPMPVAPPTLTPVVLGMNGTGGSLLYAPDGSQLLSTVGVVSGSSSASASPSPTATPASSTPTPEGADLRGASRFPADWSSTQRREQRHRLDRRRVRSPTRPTAADTWRWRSTTATAGRESSPARATDRQPDEAHRLAHAGHRADLGAERSNHLHRRHHRLLRRPVPYDRRAVHASLRLRGRSPTSPPAARTPTSRRRRAPAAHCSTSTPVPSQILQGARPTWHSAATARAWRGSTNRCNRGVSSPNRSRRTPPRSLSMPDSNRHSERRRARHRGDEITVRQHRFDGRRRPRRCATAEWHATCRDADLEHLRSSRCLRPATGRLRLHRATGATIEQAAVPGATTSQVRSAHSRRRQRHPAELRPGAGRSERPARPRHAGRAQRTPRSTPQPTLRRTSAGPTSSAHTSRPAGVVEASIELIVDPDARHTTTRVASETVLLAQSRWSTWSPR